MELRRKILRAEDLPTRRQLVQDEAKRIEIASCIKPTADRLLGRHVRGGADHDTALDALTRQEGYAKIAQSRFPQFRQKKIAGLQITMDDAGGMNITQGQKNRPANVAHDRKRQGPFCGKPLLDRSAAAPVKRQKNLPFRFRKPRKGDGRP